MSPNEQQFCTDVALAAKRLGLTPEQGLALFGAMAGGMVIYEVARNGVTREAGVDAALALFSANLFKALGAPPAGQLQ